MQVGEFALHIQCPWRIETDEQILTGRADLWEPTERAERFSHADWDYDQDGNLQDQRIEEFFSHGDHPIVESLRMQTHGCFTLALSGGCRLVVFPAGSVGEDWRLFRPGFDESHFVVSGGARERVG